MTETEWTDAEREAAWDAGMAECDCCDYPDPKRTRAVLAALAPHVAAREAQAAAKALREAADAWQTGGWASDLPPKGQLRPQLILGMAERATSWLRARADRIERSES